MTSMSHHDAPTGRRVSPPLPSSPSAPPTERSGHGAGSTVQAAADAASTVMGATARRQERLRSGRCGRSGSGPPSLRMADRTKLISGLRRRAPWRASNGIFWWGRSFFSLRNVPRRQRAEPVSGVGSQTNKSNRLLQYRTKRYRSTAVRIHQSATLSGVG